MAYRSSSDSSKFPEQDDRAYNALMHEVQHKFLWHREHTSARLQKIEDMLELAVHKLSLIRQVRQESAEEGFINTFGCQKMEKQHSECKSAADNHESLLHPNLRFPKFKEGSVVLETVVGIGNKTKEWPNLTKEGNVDRKELEAYQESPRYDEVPGEDKEDWHYNELICIALGLLDFFEPKQDSGEGNSVVAKVLPDVSIPSAWNVSIPSASKLQVPHDLNTPLDKPRLQCELNFTCLNQEVDSSDTYNKRTGVAQLHLPNEILVNYKSKCDEAKGVMQLIVADERAQTLKAKVALVLGVQTLDEDGIAGKLSQGQVELLGIDCMVDCSLKMKLFDKSLEIKSDLVAENECGDELLNSFNCVEEGAMKVWSLTPAISYCVDNMSCNFGKNEVLIFDPGGYVQSDESRCVTKKLIEMIRSKVKLDEAVLIISVDGELRHLKGKILKFLAIDKEHSQLTRKVFIVQIVDSARIRSQNIEEVGAGVSETDPQYVDHVRVGLIAIPNMCIGLKQDRRGSLVEATRLEIYEALGKKVFITIFDPGGYLNCFYHVQFGCSIEFLNDHYPLPNVLDVEELHTKRKENIVMFSSITNAPGQHFQKLVLAFCGDILLQFKAGEVYVTQLKDSFEVHDPP